MCKNTRKILKRLNRKCPDCHHVLYEIMYNKEENGVTYSDRVIECQECGYQEKRKNKHIDKFNDDY